MADVDFNDLPKYDAGIVENYLKQPGYVIGKHDRYVPYYPYFIEYNPGLLSGDDSEPDPKLIGLVHWKVFQNLLKSGVLEERGICYTDGNIQFWVWKQE